MSSLAEMRAELRELRKASKEHAPISRMKKGDISAALEALKKGREETPAAAAVPSTKTKAAPEPAKRFLKAAKETEFPHSQKPHLATAHLHKEAHNAGKKAAAPKKGGPMSKAQLRAMLDEMTSDEE